MTSSQTALVFHPDLLPTMLQSSLHAPARRLLQADGSAESDNRHSDSGSRSIPTDSQLGSRGDSRGTGASHLAQSPLLVPLLIVLLVFLFILTLLFAGFLLFKMYQGKYSHVKCHLCTGVIRRREWEDGSHRESCGKLHHNFLSQLPTPFDVRCPKCLAYLKMMPKDRGKTFSCDDSECPFKSGRIRNNGFNRLNCFRCDYDLCDSCAHRRMFILTKFYKHGGGRGRQQQQQHQTQGQQHSHQHHLVAGGQQLHDSCSLCQLELDMFPATTSLASRFDIPQLQPMAALEAPGLPAQQPVGTLDTAGSSAGRGEVYSNVYCCNNATTTTEEGWSYTNHGFLPIATYV